MRSQWADAAATFGLRLQPNLANSQGPVTDGAHGYVTTYAQVAGKPALHGARARKRRSLVILDEIHPAGDGLSWGDAAAVAFDGVQRRLSLTGTPFRTRAGERIPFVDYDIERSADGDLLRSKADFGYGYREALADRVVRPVVTGCPAVDLSEDDAEYLGLPGLLSPEQMASLLASRDAELPRRVDAASRQRFGGSAAQPADGHPDDDSVAGAGDDGAAPGWRQAVGLRREINQLVGRVSARTGSPHAAVHSQPRAAVPGPASATADVEVLQVRRDHLLGLL